MKLKILQSASVEEMTETREILDKACIPVIELIEEIEVKHKLRSTSEILLAQAENIHCRSEDALHERNEIVTMCNEILNQKVNYFWLIRRVLIRSSIFILQLHDNIFNLFKIIYI